MENEINLMEWRLVDVEEIVGNLAKIVDGLAYLCLKFHELNRRSRSHTDDNYR
jgi:hypothetical protein